MDADAPAPHSTDDMATLPTLPTDVWVRVFSYFAPETVFTVFRAVSRSWHGAARVHLSSPKNAVTARASRVRAYWATHPTKGTWTECLAVLARAGVKFDLPLVLPESCPAASLAGLLAAPVAAHVHHVVVAWRAKHMPVTDRLPSGFSGFPAAIAGQVLRGLGLRRNGASLAIKLRIPAPPSGDGQGASEAGEHAGADLERGEVPLGPAPGSASPAHAGHRSRNKWVSSAAFWDHLAALHIAFWCAEKVVRRNPYPTIDVARLPPLTGLVSLSTSLTCPTNTLLPLCPRLETLKVTRNSSLTDLNILLDKAICPALRSIHIEDCYGLVCLDGLQHRLKLTELKLVYVSCVSMASLLSLSNLISLHISHSKLEGQPPLLSFPRIRHLALIAVWLPNNFKLSRTLESCPSLEHLQFYGNFYMDRRDASLDASFCNHPTLKEVTTMQAELVRWATAMRQEDPDFDVRPLPRLSLATSVAEPTILKELPDSVQRRLRPVDIEHMNLADLAELSTACRVKHLSGMGWSVKLDPSLLNPLAHFSWASSITSIGLHHGEVADYTSLAACSSLEILYVVRPSYLNDDGRWLTTLLETLPNLLRLRISDQHLHDITPLACCRRLRALSLEGCQSLVDLTPLQHCTQLKDLDLSRMMSLQSVDGLSSCRNLRLLLLEETGVCDLTSLIAHRSLRLLSLELMEHITLNHLAPLRQCASLEWFNVCNTAVGSSELAKWLRTSQRPATLVHTSVRVRWHMSWRFRSGKPIHGRETAGQFSTLSWLHYFLNVQR